MYKTRTTFAAATAVIAAYVALPAKQSISIETTQRRLQIPFQRYFSDAKYEVSGRMPRQRLKTTSFMSTVLDSRPLVFPSGVDNRTLPGSSLCCYVRRATFFTHLQTAKTTLVLSCAKLTRDVYQAIKVSATWRANLAQPMAAKSSSRPAQPSSGVDELKEWKEEDALTTTWASWFQWDIEPCEWDTFVFATVLKLLLYPS